MLDSDDFTSLIRVKIYGDTSSTLVPSASSTDVLYLLSITLIYADFCVRIAFHRSTQLHEKTSGSDCRPTARVWKARG